jgi:hypothetical protein
MFMPQAIDFNSPCKDTAAIPKGPDKRYLRCRWSGFKSPSNRVAELLVAVAPLTILQLITRFFTRVPRKTELCELKRRIF